PPRRRAGPSRRPRSDAEPVIPGSGMNSHLRFATLLLAFGVSCAATAAAAPSPASTPKDRNGLARLSDPQVSPDGRFVVYVQRETDFEANRGRTDLWLLDLSKNSPEPRRITQHMANDSHPRWARDGGSIYFLSSRTGATQVW